MANTTKIRKVYKYGTGQPVPEGAVYLCTKTETVIEEQRFPEHNRVVRNKSNILVWHYFLVEVEPGG